MIRRWDKFFTLLLLACAVTAAVAQQPEQVLQLIGRHTQRPATFDKGSAEVVTYDAASRTAILSDAFNNKLTFVNITNPTAPTIAREVLLAAYNGVVNGVAVRNSIVAVALEDAASKANPGKVLLFNMSGVLLSQTLVGALPDQLTFTPDGQKIVVCNEGEPLNDYVQDPEGSVSILTITNPAAPTVQTVDFRSLNGRQDSLRAMGVRIYGTNATVAQDLEPEYATVTADGTTAYVTLQENNALAVIDIATASLVRIVPLGWKDYSKGLARTQTYTWTDRPSLGVTPGGQDIKLGGFSGLWFTGYGGGGTDTTKLRFLTHPDRGPNAEPTVIRGQTRRPFALPNYQLEVVALELDRTSGQVSVLSRTKLFRADGTTPISGRPNLQAAGQGIAYTDEFGVDLFGNDIANDPFGGDLEGIVVDAAGTWWMVDEYRPAIYNFNSSGVLIDRIIPQGTAASVGAPAGTYGNELLPAVYASRRANRGFEAVAIEGDVLYAFIQSPIDNPDSPNDAASKASPWCRIIAFNTVTKTVVGEYLYPMFEKAFGCDKIGDAVSLGSGKFMVIERDDATGLRARKYLMEIDLKGATNLIATPPMLPQGRTIESLSFAEATSLGIRPVNKKKSVYLPGVGYGTTDKPEGLARINAQTLLIVNDNDFGVGGSVLPAPPNGSITLNTASHPVFGVITFDRPNGLDASDRDGGNLIRLWPVYGMYQPDAISTFTANGQTYIASANEGDAREWGSFVEERRIKDLTIDASLTTAFPTLKSDAGAGRLNVVSNLGDLDGDGDYDELYTLGARSFSIWNADGNLIYDSGNEFETRTAAWFPSNFNAGHTTNARDDRSDNKGPEPEAMAMGVINDSTYAFVGCERIGHTFMYNVSDPVNPRYIDYINPRNFAVTPNVTNVDNGTVGDLGCEVIAFVPAAESPNGADLLLSGNEISGTMSIQQVRIARITASTSSPVRQCLNERFSLSVTAAGPSLTYQWAKDGVDITGATAATYTLDSARTTTAGVYTCKVRSAMGMVITSRPVTVTVSTRTRITTEPKVLTQVEAGFPVSLSVQATSTASETYQWFKRGVALANTSNITGVTTPTLNIRALAFADTSGAYYCVVTGGCATVRSRDARVYIPQTFVTLQPRDTTVCSGDTVVLRAAGAPGGGDAAVSYQWRYYNGDNLKDGGRFAGTQSPTLRINGVRPEDARQIVCVVQGFPSRQIRFSNTITIAVRQAPRITKQPTAPNGTREQQICEGLVFQLRAMAEGEQLAYQWFRNGVAIPRATQSDFTSTTPGTYVLSVRGVCGQTLVSDTVRIISTVRPSLGTIRETLVRVKEGDAFTLSVNLAQGSQPVQYQWSLGGRAIAGATSSTYTVNGTTASDAGLYVCTATNDCGSDISAVVEVRTYRDDPTSVNEQVARISSVRVEPHPVASISYLRITAEQAGTVRIVIRDMQGREVFSTTAIVAEAGDTAIMLNATTLGSAGLYNATITAGGSTMNVPLVVAP
jgi:hypothetical protein